MRKYLLIDTETTKNGLVLDVGIKLIHGNKVISSHGFIIGDVWEQINFGNDELFNSSKDKDKKQWYHKKYLDKRMQAYENMLKNGQRSLISIEELADDLSEAERRGYIFSAYNAGFDKEKIEKTLRIQIAMPIFCLWEASKNFLSAKKKRLKSFKRFCFVTHNAFKNKIRVTPHLNAKTDCATVAIFFNVKDESYIHPHTAFEDLDSELGILLKLKGEKDAYNKVNKLWPWSVQDLLY